MRNVQVSPRLMVTTGARRRLLAVLVQAEVGAGRVEVHDAGVGLVVDCLGAVGAVAVGHRTAGERVRRSAGIGFTGAPSVSSAVRE